MWVQIAIIVFSLVLSRAMAPKPQQPAPAALADFDLPQAKEGTPRAVVFGDGWVSGWTVLGAGNYRAQAITAGGKK